MRFSANIGFLFADRPHTERIGAAAVAGFGAVEMHWPYDVPAAETRAALSAAGIGVLALNTPTGNVPAGDFGLGGVPGRQAEFRDGFAMALDYAEAIGAGAIHCMAGVVDPSARSAAEAVFAENLAHAADLAAKTGRTILVEPINHHDRPSYLLNSVEQAARLIGGIGRPNVKVLFDCYHVQILQGDLTRRIEAMLPLIGHVQIAAVPSRAEPDEGELAYAHVLATLDRLGYSGWIGAEYRPRGRTEDGLGWMAALGGR
jgi:2-dehydrotetronate isomerase